MLITNEYVYDSVTVCYMVIFFPNYIENFILKVADGGTH